MHLRPPPFVVISLLEASPPQSREWLAWIGANQRSPQPHLEDLGLGAFNEDVLDDKTRRSTAS